jgi:hypothetical protein
MYQIFEDQASFRGLSARQAVVNQTDFDLVVCTTPTELISVDERIAKNRQGLAVR